MLQKIISFGLQPNQSKAIQLRIKMFNGISVATIFIMILYSAFYLLSDDGNSVMVSHSLYLITSLFILFFNYKNQYQRAELALNIFFPLSFINSCIFLGQAYHAEYLLFLTAFGTSFIYKKSIIKFLLLGLNITLFITAKVYYLYYPEGLITLNPKLIPFSNAINGLIVLFMTYAIINIVFGYNRKLYFKLKKLTKNQENIIQKRTQEIQKKSQALKQSNQELKQFAYISAHDLREPLRNIVGFSQLLKKDLLTNKKEHIDEYLNYIQQSVYRIDTITKDIVNYTELEEQLTNIIDINPNKVIDEICAAALENQKNIVFNIQSLPTLRISQEACYKLFSNLIGNAIQYSNKSIIKVTVTYEILDKYCQIMIKDNGDGIAPEYFEKIFMMFKRLHNDIDKNGSGIGLAICKKIVTTYGGKIWVESEVEQGSTFYFSLPITND